MLPKVAFIVSTIFIIFCTGLWAHSHGASAFAIASTFASETEWVQCISMFFFMFLFLSKIQRNQTQMLNLNGPCR